MRAEVLIEGLMANYPPSMHPTDVQRKDMQRVLRNLGYDEEQLTLLYDELLRSCQFFPKIYDLHTCAQSLGLKRSGYMSEAEKTRKVYLENGDPNYKAISFKEFMETGGYEMICADCEYDMAEVRKRLKIMGCVGYMTKNKPKTHKADLDFLSEAVPSMDFPGIEVEIVETPFVKWDEI